MSVKPVQEDKKTGYHGAFRQSMSWFHTWTGLVFSLVLYFVFITGTIGYFNAEVDHWMQPEAPASVGDRSDEELLQLGLDYLAREAPDATRWFVNMPPERGSALVRIFAQLKEPLENGDRQLSAFLDPVTGEEAELRETGGGNLLYRMHYALHYIPYGIAIYIVGVATLLMWVAIVTGIIVHKKIFKDFFTLRLNKGQRSWLDSHNASSVLALPFMVMITYSGLLFFEFEYSPGVIFLTMGIEQEAVAEMTEHIRPGLQTEEAAGVTAVLVPLTEPLRKAREQWNGASPSYIQVQHPGDQAAVITMGKRSDDLTRRAATLRFRGATGELLEPAPPWSGDVVFNSVVLALHEGRFASYPLRWLYFLSGLLGAAMIATGLLLWAKKRHARLRGATPGRGLIFIERTNLAIIVGLPLAVLAYFWANRLLPVAMAQREAWEVHCMFLVWALSFAHAGFRELRRAWREQVAVLALLCLLLPVLSTLTTDVGLVSSLREGDWLRAGFELFSVGFGLALCLSWPRLKAPEPRPGNTATDTASPMSTTVPGSAEV